MAHTYNEEALKREVGEFNRKYGSMLRFLEQQLPPLPEPQESAPSTKPSLKAALEHGDVDSENLQDVLKYHYDLQPVYTAENPGPPRSALEALVRIFKAITNLDDDDTLDRRLAFKTFKDYNFNAFEIGPDDVRQRTFAALFDEAIDSYARQGLDAEKASRDADNSIRNAEAINAQRMAEIVATLKFLKEEWVYQNGVRPLIELQHPRVEALNPVDPKLLERQLRENARMSESTKGIIDTFNSFEGKVQQKLAGLRSEGRSAG